jgi:hypothetical protein
VYKDIARSMVKDTTATFRRSSFLRHLHHLAANTCYIALAQRTAVEVELSLPPLCADSSAPPGDNLTCRSVAVPY